MILLFYLCMILMASLRCKSSNTAMLSRLAIKSLDHKGDPINNTQSSPYKGGGSCFCVPQCWTATFPRNLLLPLFEGAMRQKCSQRNSFRYFIWDRTSTRWDWGGNFHRGLAKSIALVLWSATCSPKARIQPIIKASLTLARQMISFHISPPPPGHNQTILGSGRKALHSIS